jgi:hypothetical protein
MPFQVAPGCAEFSFNQRLHGQRVQNNITLWSPGLVWTSEDLTTAANALYGWFGGTVMANLSYELTLVEVVGKYLGMESGPIGTRAPAEAMAGLGGDQSSPANVTACISFRTGLSGRSYRGRNYIAGIQEEDTSGSRFAAALLTGLQSAYEALGDVLTGLANPAQHVVLSRYALGSLRPEAIPTAVLSYLFVDDAVDSQRRRLIGRGQ